MRQEDRLAAGRGAHVEHVLPGKDLQCADWQGRPSIGPVDVLEQSGPVCLRGRAVSLRIRPAFENQRQGDLLLLWVTYLCTRNLGGHRAHQSELVHGLFTTTTRRDTL